MESKQTTGEASTSVLPRKPGTKEGFASTADLPLVSIIVVNYNGEDVLPKCLSALSHLEHPNCEIIIVDNGSSDGSFEFAADFTSKFPQHVLRFPKNRGLAIARNAGVRMAKGSFIAFVDNDGFPEPGWLNAAIDTFAEDPRIGAVASLVLFDTRSDIINGLGGGVNERGFGFDFLYHRPLGFHDAPMEILYPMGCGMVLRQEAAALIFPIDEMLVNYYDDVEIGIRTWQRGYRVAPCAKARVRHAFSHSSQKRNPLKKEILCHRNRLRTALKYWPASKLPMFVFREFVELWEFMWKNQTGLLSIFFWNLWHLKSALAIRSRFPMASCRLPLPTAVAPKELRYYPKNTEFLPKWEEIGEVVDIEKPDHQAALDFGWYYIENIHQEPFRYTTDIASVYIRTKEAINSFLLRYMPYTDEPFVIELVDKAQARVLYRWELTGEIFQIRSVRRPVALPPGDYQVLFKCDFKTQPGCGRVLGISVNFVGLWNLP
jgi:GT2 family glycosyltransferase